MVDVSCRLFRVGRHALSIYFRAYLMDDSLCDLLVSFHLSIHRVLSIYPFIISLLLMVPSFDDTSFLFPLPQLPIARTIFGSLRRSPSSSIPGHRGTFGIRDRIRILLLLLLLLGLLLLGFGWFLWCGCWGWSSRDRCWGWFWRWLWRWRFL